MTSSDLLVIILSATLAVFLFLAIIATVKVIQVLNHLKSITETAEKLANTAESVGEFFKYTAGPAAIGRFISNISESVMKHNKKSKDKSNE